MITFMQQAGFEPRYGRRVVAELAAAGLTDVRGERRALIIDSRSPGFDFFRLSFESLRDAVVNADCCRVKTPTGGRPLCRGLARADTAHDGRNRSPLNGFAPVERQLPGRRC